MARRKFLGFASQTKFISIKAIPLALKLFLVKVYGLVSK
jgi:hypothetical protein